MKTLVLYVFHQVTFNVLQFLEEGLIDDPEYTFVMICNGYSIPVEHLRAPRLWVLRRENIGLDFAAWNDALFLPTSILDSDEKVFRVDSVKFEGEPLHSKFDRFVFLNSTVSGPYLPSYVDKNWVECFTQRLSETVGIVGISINFHGLGRSDYAELFHQHYGIEATSETHVQSMAYALTRRSLDILLSKKFYSCHRSFPSDKNLLIILFEIGMTAILRDAGLDAFSLMTDQGLVRSDEVRNTNDQWYGWTGRTFPLYETIFIKSNRGIRFLEKSRYDRSSKSSLLRRLSLEQNG